MMIARPPRAFLPVKLRPHAQRAKQMVRSLLAIAGCIVSGCAHQTPTTAPPPDVSIVSGPLVSPVAWAASVDADAPYDSVRLANPIDDPWWGALKEACAERGWRFEQRVVLQDAYELSVIDAMDRDVGIVSVELGSGMMTCELSGHAKNGELAPAVGCSMAPDESPVPHTRRAGACCFSRRGSPVQYGESRNGRLGLRRRRHRHSGFSFSSV